MSLYVISGHLTQLKGKTKTTLGKLMGDQQLLSSGRKDLIVGELQIKYKLGMDEKEMIKEWDLN